MKKKIITVLGMAVCMALLFGCGQKEAEGTAAAPQTAETREAAGQEPMPEKQGNTQVEIVTPGDVATKDPQVDGYTLEEIKAGLANTSTIYAVKKGDLFYPLGDGALYSVQAEDHTEFIVVGGDEIVQSADLSQGDAVVVFASRNYSSRTVPALENGYCIPTTVEQNDGYITMRGVQEGELSGSFVDGDAAAWKFEEYAEGNIIITDADRAMGLAVGEKDEVLEFGGYEGTQYLSASYKCNGQYFRYSTKGLKEEEAAETASATDSITSRLEPDQYQLTQEGYAVLTSKDYNPFGSGLYIIHANPAFVVKIK